MTTIGWDYKTIGSHTYTCGHCGNPIASNKGWDAAAGSAGRAQIYICHQCTKPTFFDTDSTQIPGSIFGDSVNDIPDEKIENLYNEARNVISTNSFTAAVLCCRKILMHIAVSKSAKPGQNFIKYVEYLEEHHYVPPDAKQWVDHIRNKANEANHEITIMSENDAKDLIEFIEMLLKIIYEFPAAAKRKSIDS